MPYKVLKDGVTLQIKHGIRRSARDRTLEIDLVHSAVFYEGDYISDEELAPVHQEQYKNDEGDIKERISKVSKKEYDKSQDADSNEYLEEYQAEGGGPVDEPRKIREALTGQDMDGPKAQVIENASKDSDSDK